MITCEVLRRHIDAFVDGEVDPDTHIEFEQHLASCGPCRVQLSFARSMKAQVREACGGVKAPPSLADRLQKALDAEDARQEGARDDSPVGASTETGPPLGIGGIRLLPVKAKYAVPAAAAAALLAFLAANEGGNPVAATAEDNSGGWFQGAAAHTGSLFEEVVRRHSIEHPAEVVGPPTQVASWFRGKLEFPVRPVRFSSPDVQLVGARLSNVQDRDAAAFYYDVRGRRVTVMVFEPPEPVDEIAVRTSYGGRGIYYGQAHGYTVPVVQYEGLTYAFTGDLDSRALLRLAASARMADR